MVSVHPCSWCTFPLGVVPAGSGDGVGDCVFLFPFFNFSGDKTLLFFQGMVFHFSLVLHMLVARREPTPWVSRTGHFGREAGKNTVRKWFLPFLDVSSW